MALEKGCHPCTPAVRGAYFARFFAATFFFGALFFFEAAAAAATIE